MLKKLLIGFIIAVSFIVLLLYFASEKGEEENKIGVIVSILPQVEFVEKVGGERVKITVMVPPMASPHTYEPKASQLAEVSKAKIYFKVGSGIEFEKVWWDKIISMNPNIYVINASEGIEIVDKDPHIWLSPKIAEKMVENFYNGIIKVDPEHKEEYRRNKEKYIEELKELDRFIRNLFEKYENRVFLIYHPSFGYFAREYNLTQLAIEEEGKEPSPSQLKKCIENARKYNLSYVYLSPQVSESYANVIAHEINGEIIKIDPLAPNYIDNMRNVAILLSKEFE